MVVGGMEVVKEVAACAHAGFVRTVRRVHAHVPSSSSSSSSSAPFLLALAAVLVLVLVLLVLLLPAGEGVACGAMERARQLLIPQ